MQGSVLGAAAEFLRRLFLFGAGLGLDLSSGVDTWVCETELEGKCKLDVSHSSIIFPTGPLLTLAPLPVQVQQ